MKNCKKHQDCQFEGKGRHKGCYMHGVIDSCTNERQQLFKDGHLACALPYEPPKPMTKEEAETYEKRQHELAVARISASGGGGMFAGIIIGLILGILITFII